MNAHRDLLPVPDVAERLDVSPDSIYRAIDRGDLDAVRLGPRNTRIPRNSLLDYLMELNT